MKRFTRTYSVAILVGLVLSLPMITAAQEPTSITGTVVDEQGANIAKALVRLRSREGKAFSKETDTGGGFQFSNLKAGEYLLEVESEGFAILTSPGITLGQGENKRVRLQLKLASISETVVVTASGTVQRADEVGKVLSTVNDDQLEARHELSLAEAMRGIPGARVQQQGSPGALTTVRLRGQRPFDTAILLDGLRVRDASDLNGSAVSLLTDLVAINTERVEILRGSGSSIYGTNAIGGVINIVPTEPVAGLRFELGAEGGSLSTFRERLKVSGGQERVNYSLALTRNDVRRGIDGEDQYGNSAAAGRIHFSPSASTTLSGTVYGTVANARLNDSPFALPAAFSVTQFPRAIAGANFQPDFNNPDQGRRNRLLVGAFKFLHQLNDQFSYTVTYQRVSSNRRNYNGQRIDPRFSAFYPFGDFEFINVNKGITDTLDARLHMRLGQANLATIGFEFEHESFFQHSQPSFALFDNTTDRQRTLALFGQDQLSLLNNKLQVSLAVRGQFFGLSAADRPGFLGDIDTEKSFTGDGAVAYLFSPTQTKFRVHAGNAFRAPALFERFGAGTLAGLGLVRFGDPTLKPEQSVSVDGGLDQRFAGERAIAGFTYFYTRRQRVISFAGFAIDPLGLGRFSGYQNEPGGIARGFESFLEATPARGLQLRASYTYTNSDRFNSSIGLAPEYVIPKNLFGLTLNHRYRSFVVNFDLNVTGAYLAPVFENGFPFRMAELTFAGYTKADVFGSYEQRISEGIVMVLFAGGENIFNRTYFENGFRAPGAVARAGINFKF